MHAMTPTNGIRISTSARRTRSHQAGATVVEFALVASLLFSVLLAIVDFGHMFWVNLTMQHAVREGARYAVTGRADLDPTPGNPTERCDAVIEKIRRESMGLYDQVVQRVDFKTVAGGAVTTLGAGSCYGAGQIIVVDVQAAAPVLTPFLRPLFTGGEYRFSVSTTMKNEAYR